MPVLLIVFPILVICYAIFVLGSTGDRIYMVQTYANDINFEMLYALDLRCFDNGTLGVNGFDTNTNTVVRFVGNDVPVITDISPMTSSFDFATNSFESSTYTHGEMTNETTSFSSSAYPSSYVETTTPSTTVSTPELTTPVSGD